MYTDFTEMKKITVRIYSNIRNVLFFQVLRILLLLVLFRLNKYSTVNCTICCEYAYFTFYFIDLPKEK